MAKKGLITNTDNDQPYQYVLIKTIEDLEADDAPFCHAPKDDLITCLEEGRIIMVNNLGGYCFFEEGYHTIVNTPKPKHRDDVSCGSFIAQQAAGLQVR